MQQSSVPECASEDSSVDFTVLGSTGNVYTVTLGHVPSCNCPDHRKRQDLCKHILFVSLKVIGLSSSDPLSYQKAYVTSELETLFEKLRHRRVGGTVLANEQVRAAVTGEPMPTETDSDHHDDDPTSHARRRSLDDGDADCPICYDTLQDCPASQLTFCRSTCGANFHADCIQKWLSQGRNKGCPTCRQPWQHAATSAAAAVRIREGYVNYGALQGQSADRDTSTYHSSPSSSRYRSWRY